MRASNRRIALDGLVRGAHSTVLTMILNNSSSGRDLSRPITGSVNFGTGSVFLTNQYSRVRRFFLYGSMFTAGKRLPRSFLLVDMIPMLFRPPDTATGVSGYLRRSHSLVLVRMKVWISHTKSTQAAEYQYESDLCKRVSQELPDSQSWAGTGKGKPDPLGHHHLPRLDWEDFFDHPRNLRCGDRYRLGVCGSSVMGIGVCLLESINGSIDPGWWMIRGMGTYTHIPDYWDSEKAML